MARESKQDKLAREQAKLDLDYSEFVKGYSLRFANLMFEMMTNNHVFTVKRLDSETYSFSKNKDNNGFTLKVTPPVITNWESPYQLNMAEMLVAEYYDETQEQARKYAVKLSALSKLNNEERELLGVSGNSWEFH